MTSSATPARNRRAAGRATVVSCAGSALYLRPWMNMMTSGRADDSGGLHHPVDRPAASPGGAWPAMGVNP